MLLTDEQLAEIRRRYERLQAMDKSKDPSRRLAVELAYSEDIPKLLAHIEAVEKLAGGVLMRLTDEQIKEITERAETAHSAPWEYISEGNVIWHVDYDLPIAEEIDHVCNGEFIAHARTDIPRLLAHFTTQEEEIKRLLEFVQEVANETTGWGIIKTKARRLLDGQQ